MQLVPRREMEWTASAAVAPVAETPKRASARDWLPSGVAEWFIVSQTLLPALLFFPGAQPYRLLLRVGAYGISLAAFAIWWLEPREGRSLRHPAKGWLWSIVAYLIAMIAHPWTNNLTSGIAQTMLYLAIFCPVFWAPAYIQRPWQLVRILTLLLVCNGINSIVGVLQVYDPARWMPSQLSQVLTPMMLASMTYIGPNGVPILRPPGLFDTPGAVCAAGGIAVLLGLIITIEPIEWWKRLAALVLAGAGMSAIYLSHVRASFSVTLGAMVAYLGLLSLQGERKRATGLVACTAVMMSAAFSLAIVLGGQSIHERFSSLFQEDPRQVYYQSRGLQVEYAFSTLAVQYPFGAGLARWGMMRNYFGNPANLDSAELFAEVQPNAWILDGGVVLLALYSIALSVTLVADLKLIKQLRDRNDRILAATVVSANLSVLALVFTFVPFGTAIGIQYWFLEGALHGAMRDRPRHHRHQ